MILFEAMDETKTWWEVIVTISVLTRRIAEDFMLLFVTVHRTRDETT